MYIDLIIISPRFGWPSKTYYNFLLRLSGGVFGNLHIFISEPTSIYLGGGGSYNSLMLNAFNGAIKAKGRPLGFSFQAGYRNWKSNYSIELQANIIKGKSLDNSDGISEMSFSGVSLKGGYSF